MARVTIDKDRCVSSGRCIADEPGAFGFDDDELVSLISGAESLSLQRLVVIARRCPGLAIAVFDDEGIPVAP